MMFVLKYVRTLHVLLTFSPPSASVAVIVDVRKWLRSGIRVARFGQVSHFQSVASGQRKGQCLVRYAELKSVVTVQCNFRPISLYRFDLL
jgi:hypothetical protein